MSQDTFLYNLKKGEILPDGRSVEEEKDLISVEFPAGGGRLTGDPSVRSNDSGDGLNNDSSADLSTSADVGG